MVAEFDWSDPKQFQELLRQIEWEAQKAALRGWSNPFILPAPLPPVEDAGTDQ